MTTEIVQKRAHYARIVTIDETVPVSLDPAITVNSRSNDDDRLLAAIDGEVETVVFEPETKERRRRRRRSREEVIDMADGAKPFPPEQPEAPEGPNPGGGGQDDL